MPSYSIAGEHQFAVTWVGAKLRFTRTSEKVTEIEKSSAVDAHYDGGSNEVHLWSDRPKYGPVTATAVFRPETDAAIIKTLLDLVGDEEGQLIVQPLDASMARVGSPITVQGMVSSVRAPKSDANASQTKAEWSFTITPAKVA